MDAWPSPYLVRLPQISRIILFVTLVACGTQVPVVANPPNDLSEATIDEPWLQDERAMMRNPYADLSGADPHSEEDFNGPLEETQQRSFVDVCVDVLAFPFRGVGWLIQALL